MARLHGGPAEGKRRQRCTTGDKKQRGCRCLCMLRAGWRMALIEAHQTSTLQGGALTRRSREARMRRSSAWGGLQFGAEAETLLQLARRVRAPPSRKSPRNPDLTETGRANIGLLGRKRTETVAQSRFRWSDLKAFALSAASREDNPAQTQTAKSSFEPPLGGSALPSRPQSGCCNPASTRQHLQHPLNRVRHLGGAL